MNISINSLANTVMEELTRYSDLATVNMKSAVKNAAKTVKNEIVTGAPKKTGAYAKSWTSSTTAETANKLEITVHSKNKYQLAHLLEHGHAKRNGGRVAAQVHIAPAKEAGITQLENEIVRSLQNG